MFDKKKQNFLFRKKLNFFLKPIVIISCIFIVYQLIMFIQLTKSPAIESNTASILGTHYLRNDFYNVGESNYFTCVESMEKIEAKYLNDDYCDCLDGSDEPGTNACSNGRFFCTKQVKYLNYAKSVPSNRVNDGICDCCDGSDEWEAKKLTFRLKDEVQQKIGHYQSPCPILCN